MEGTRPEIKDKGSPLYKFRAHIKMLDEHVKDKPDKFEKEITGFDEPGGFRCEPARSSAFVVFSFILFSKSAD